MIALAVAVAGSVGAVLRMVIDGYVKEHVRDRLPWGTLVVNVAGSFLLGLLTGVGRHHGMGPVPVALLETGLCGALTTFSTFSYETVRLAESGAAGRAALNVLVSLAAGLGAAVAGLALVAATA